MNVNTIVKVMAFVFGIAMIVVGAAVIVKSLFFRVPPIFGWLSPIMCIVQGMVWLLVSKTIIKGERL